MLLGRARLACAHLPRRQRRPAAGSLGDHALQHAGHFSCNLGGEHLLARYLRVVDERRAVLRDHLGDAGIGVADAPGRECSVGARHAQRVRLSGAERERGVGSVAVLRIAGNAEARRHVEQALRRHAVGVGDKAGKTGIGGDPGHSLDGKVPVVCTRIVGDGLAPCRVHEPRGAVDNRFRADALLDGGGQRERLERRARLAPRRACREVELAVRPIPSAYHSEHVPGVRVDARHRKAHIAIAGSRHIVVHFRSRFLRVALKRRVDRGVDRKTAVEHLLERELVEELLAHVAREIRVLVDAVLGACFDA